MTADQWQRVKEVFQSALERDAGARRDFLESVCGNDSAVRAEVESLIAAHERDPDFIEAAAEHARIPAHRYENGAVPAITPGQRIGVYQLLRPIDSGGMGTVYLAVRADDEYRKQVAIKVIRSSGGDDPSRRAELLRRLRHERQMLAGLEHPHIARLLDGGSTPDGLPYLVMEYIEGQRLDIYCDEHGLSTVERLELFRAICGAVHYAHQNLIIHRDLKPGNILVTAAGVPKLLDFGLAKLVDTDSSSSALIMTRPGQQPMTPAYASPEQIRGQPLTTASDVYALGVILYELLTGHRPYRAASNLPHELARAICEHEPDRPSSAVTRVEEVDSGDGSSSITLTPESVSRTRDGRPDKLRRRLAGDIDMIVLKALRKEPERRYASVEQFSEDIRRHLDGLPVTARPDTLTYRAGKFIRRHRVGVLATAVVLLALVGGIVGTTWQARIAEQRTRDAEHARSAEKDQRKAAEKNLSRAEEAERQAATEAGTAKEVSQFLVDLFNVSDPLGASTDEPSGASVTAGALLERSAERIATELAGQPLTQATLMDALGQVYRNLGLLDDAQRLLESALATRRRILGTDHTDVATSIYNLGDVLLRKANYAQAEPLLQESLDMRRKLLGDQHSDTVQSLDSLARLFEETGDYAQAESLYREALDAIRAAGVRDPTRINSAEEGKVIGHLAALLRSRGRLDDAEQLQREALEILRKIHGDRHPIVAVSLMDLADVAKTRRDYVEAERLCREALAIYEQTVGEDHPFYADGLHNLATVLKGKGDLDAAEPLQRRALELLRQRHGAEHPFIAQSLNNLGELLVAKKQPVEAESLFREALELRRRALPVDHPLIAETLYSLASLLLTRKEYVEAESRLREALSIRRQSLSDTHPSTIKTINSLAMTLYYESNLAEAETLCREVLDYKRSTLPAADPGLVEPITGVGVILTRAERFAEAEPLLREALAIRRRADPPDPLSIADGAWVLSGCLLPAQRYDEAEPLVLEAYSVSKAHRGEEHPWTLKALNRLIEIYDKWGKPDQAAEYRARLPESGVPGS